MRHRPVALKFLAAHLLQNEEARKRFQREAKAAVSGDNGESWSQPVEWLHRIPLTNLS